MIREITFPINRMNSTNQGTNPAIVELRALRNEVTELKDELAGFRSDFKKLKLTRTIASGVLLSGIVLWGLVLVLGTFAQIFSR